MCSTMTGCAPFFGLGGTNMTSNQCASCPGNKNVPTEGCSPADRNNKTCACAQGCKYFPFSACATPACDTDSDCPDTTCGPSKTCTTAATCVPYTTEGLDAIVNSSKGSYGLDPVTSCGTEETPQTLMLAQAGACSMSRPVSRAACKAFAAYSQWSFADCFADCPALKMGKAGSLDASCVSTSEGSVYFIGPNVPTFEGAAGNVVCQGSKEDPAFQQGPGKGCYLSQTSMFGADVPSFVRSDGPFAGSLEQVSGPLACATTGRCSSPRFLTATSCTDSDCADVAGRRGLNPDSVACVADLTYGDSGTAKVCAASDAGVLCRQDSDCRFFCEGPGMCEGQLNEDQASTLGVANNRVVFPHMLCVADADCTT